MKILFFARDLAVGGSQRQLAMLASGLARRGHEVTIAIFYPGDEVEGARDLTQRVVPLGKAGRWHAIGPLARLRRLLTTEQPDVLYAFLPMQTALAALLLPPRQATKLVFGVRAAGMRAEHYDRLSALSYRLEAWLSRRAHLIIANSGAGRVDAMKRGMPQERIVVVRNGIDTETMRPDPAAGRAQRRAWGLPDDAFVIGCVARLDPMKDHANLLAAAASFAATHADARFVCVGDGPAWYRDQLTARASSHGLEGRLVWAGAISDVRSAYNAFDIATLPSAFGEGFPNVVGEAMACGIPVVATDVGDIRTIVGELGEVVPPSQAELLCAGWTRLRQRLSAGENLREAVRNSISSFSVDAVVGRTEAIFVQLVADSPARAIASEIG